MQDLPDNPCATGVFSPYFVPGRFTVFRASPCFGGPHMDPNGETVPFTVTARTVSEPGAAVPKTNLTHRTVQSLSTDKDREEFWDENLTGFGVRISGRTGKKTFVVRYRANGRRRRMSLGNFQRVSLAEAREEAKRVLAKSDLGEDPAAERESDGDTTFKALADEVMEARGRKTRESTHKDRLRKLNQELLPAWGKRPVSTITRRDVVDLVEGIANRGAPVHANRVLSLIHLIFNDGIRRGFPTLEANPAHLVEPPGEENSRDRYLTREEIKAVWKALEEETPLTRTAFKLALLTAQRIGAICAMRWDTVTGDVWRIPAEDFKGGREHWVPLSPEATEALEWVQQWSGDTYVFPSRAGTKLPHIRNLSSNALQRIRKRTNIPHWVTHDFRTTFRTHAVRPRETVHDDDQKGLGVTSQVADAVLGHREATVGARHYTGDVARYLLSEKREALTRWGAFVRKAVEGDKDNE